MVLSSVVGITNAYLSYKTFVFKTKGNYAREYARSYIVYGINFGVNAVYLPLMVESLHVHPLIAQAFYPAIAGVISYFGHKYISFKR